MFCDRLQAGTRLGCFAKLDAIYLTGFTALPMEKHSVFHLLDRGAEPPVPGTAGQPRYTWGFREGLETFCFWLGFSVSETSESSPFGRKQTGIPTEKLGTWSPGPLGLTKN